MTPSFAHDLVVLARLRLILLTRVRLKRYTHAAHLAAPFYLGFTVVGLITLLWLASKPMTALMTYLLSGSNNLAELQNWLAWASSSALLLVFFYALLTLTGMLSNQSDLKVLLIAPASPRVIMGEKLLNTSFLSSTGLLLSVPVVIGLGNALHQGLAYDAVAILILLVMPIPSVCLALFLILGLSQFLPAQRARTITTIFGTVITGVLYVVQQSLVLSSSRAGSRVTAPLLPATLPTTWPGRALAAIALGNVHDTAMYLTATLAVSACLLAVAVILAARLMTGGAGVYQEVGQRRKRTGVDTHSGALGLGPITAVSPDRQPSQPAWVTLLGKEWILLRRDASRLAAMMYPLFIIGFYLTRAFETGPPSSTGGASDHLSGLISGSMYWILTLTIILLLNAVTPSIVNREGKSLYLLSVAPVEAREILVAKWAICAAPILLLVEGLLIIGALAERISLYQATISAIGLAIMVCTLVVMVISINLRWPHLDVSSPWKQSSVTASFIDLVAKVLVAVPCCGLLILAFSLWDSWPLYSLVAVIFFLGLTSAVASSSYRSSTRRLTNLMVGE